MITSINSKLKKLYINKYSTCISGTALIISNHTENFLKVKTKVCCLWTEKLSQILILFNLIGIRDIPQGTVDNNLGPDRLAYPKALDSNYCRQPTLWLHDLCQEVLTVHGIELRLFWAKAFPPAHTINVAHLT